MTTCISEHTNRNTYNLAFVANWSAMKFDITLLTVRNFFKCLVTWGLAKLRGNATFENVIVLLEIWKLCVIQRVSQ